VDANINLKEDNMEIYLLWIALAAIFGSALAALIKVVTPGPPYVWTYFPASLLTGVITAVVFAVGYQLGGPTLTVKDIFLAILGGAAVDQTRSMLKMQKELLLLKGPVPKK
jgi:hypothetical protein